MQVTTVVVNSWVQQLGQVQKTASRSPPRHPPALTFFLSPRPQWSLSLGRGARDVLFGAEHLASLIPSTVINYEFALTTAHCGKKAALGKAESSQSVRNPEVPDLRR